ncbi:hypothetical protein JNL27_14930 [bacterium]|nr:hypothetical protein [bacterium]
MKTLCMALIYLIILSPHISMAQTDGKLSFQLSGALFSSIGRGADLGISGQGVIVEGGINYQVKKELEIGVIYGVANQRQVSLKTISGVLKYRPWPTDWPNTYIIGKYGALHLNKTLAKYSDEMHTHEYLPYTSASKWGSTFEVGLGKTLLSSQRLDLGIEGTFRTHYIEYDRDNWLRHYGKASLNNVSIKASFIYKL